MFFGIPCTGRILSESSVLAVVLLLPFAESSADLVIEPGQLVTGHMTILDNVTNHGALVGTGNNQDDRIEVGSQYRVTGSGLFQNTLIRGTFAPGNSPGVVNGTNQAFGGTLEIELGGTSPGFGRLRQAAG